MMICTTLYKIYIIHICTTFKIYVPVHAVLHFFHTAQVRNLKRMNVVQ